MLHSELKSLKQKRSDLMHILKSPFISETARVMFEQQLVNVEEQITVAEQKINS